MIKIEQRPYGYYLVLRHETAGEINPDGTLVAPVATECELEIPSGMVANADLIVEVIREHLDDCGALEEDDFDK